MINPSHTSRLAFLAALPILAVAFFAVRLQAEGLAWTQAARLGEEADAKFYAITLAGQLVEVSRSDAKAQATNLRFPPVADAIARPRHSQLLVLPAGKSSLSVVGREGKDWSIRTTDVCRDAASLGVSPDGSLASVVGSWSRQLDFVDLAGGGPRVVRSIALPFVGGKQATIGGGKEVIVADAFAGELALVDSDSGRIPMRASIPGHNIGGLQVDPAGEWLAITHQRLDSASPTSLAALQAGRVVSNWLRIISLAELRRDPRRAIEHSKAIPLDGQSGAGDPSDVAWLGKEQWLVSLAGCDEVALVGAKGIERRVKVGARPTKLILDKGHERAWCLASLGDRIEEIELPELRVVRTVALQESREQTPAAQGRRLFFDARLSATGAMSCHSCHSLGHTPGLRADTLGDGGYGAPKRIPTLLGTSLTDRWSWNAEQKSLYDQTYQSLESTMHGANPSADQAADLVTFLHTLAPPPPLLPATNGEEDRAAIERGRKLFAARGCADCHIPPLTYTSPDAYDVGLADEAGRKKFNPPSLKGVGQAYRLLHDARAATLEEVFDRYGHPSGERWPREERADLLRFLRSL